ncbi:HNH endonuclease [Pseudomonas sp. FW300-N2A2]|uniref:HNH endonuclease n=1 Tax=Pseudomonas sp. FW300-N2A2 TaxID=2751316 RepID=UPI001A921AFD|nr:hypothetical protein [Pseudomonas sp. FW300-N2A2]
MTSQPPQPVELKLRAVKKKKPERRERMTLLHELRRAAKAGDKEVWTRLGDIEDAKHSDLKKLLRKSLMNRQEPRCCYCKRWLLNNAHAAPIEHVLPRHVYPEFVLRTRNLAIICVDCNSIKSKADWGKFAAPHRRYPAVETMTFFHPRFHNYDEHVRFMRMETNRYEFVTYHGLTPQGQHLCSELLSKVVGKQSLKRNYPTLAGWVRMEKTLDAEPETTPRPALEAFRSAMDRVFVNRLNDGNQSTALWAHP